MITDVTIQRIVKADLWKESLFETVSFQPDWDLEFKSIFYEFQQDVTPAIHLLLEELTGRSGLLIERAPPLANADIFAQFIARGNPQLTDLHDIALIDPAAKPPPANIIKWLGWAIKKAVLKIGERLNRRAFLPNVDEKLQQQLARLQPYIPTPVMRAFQRIGKYGGFAATMALLLVGVLGLLPTVAAFLPPSGAVIISSILLRITVDICQGKNVLYAVGKAIALWQAGVEAKDLMANVLDYVNSNWPKIGEWLRLHPTGPKPSELGITSGGTGNAPSGDIWPQPSADTSFDYTVKQGDVLSKIAQQNAVSTEELKNLNNIPNVHKLKVGQVLRIPNPSGLPPYAPSKFIGVAGTT